MNKNAKRSVRFVKISGVSATLVALLMAGGCGSDSGSVPATQSNSTTLTSTNSTLNSNGTVTTTTAVTAMTAAGVPAVTIPASTTITAKDATGATVPFTALPAIKVDTPTSGVTGMPNPTTQGFTIASTAGAVDITIGGMNTVTFSPAITLTIPVDPAKVTNRTVHMNKNDGKGWIDLGTATITGNVATVTTTSLCWFGIDNIYKSATGSTGSGSGSGAGF